MAAKGYPSRNRLLASLSVHGRALLETFLTPVELPLETVLSEPNKPIRDVYFLESGFASVVAGDGNNIEIGMVGREGMTGLSIVMGADRSVNRAFVQAAGSALRMSAQDLRVAMGRSKTLRSSLLLYAQVFSVQVGQTALVNGRARIEARLARWLLMAHDRCGGGSVPFTHRFLALMLGVRRPGVTLALHFLEGYGLIKIRRGQFTVVDRKGLEARSDPSYGVPEAEYERLIPRPAS
jgi:CRP-like cAMP-binding protein